MYFAKAKNGNKKKSKPAMICDPTSQVVATVPNSFRFSLDTEKYSDFTKKKAKT